MKTKHQEKIRELVRAGLARVVRFNISPLELINEYERLRHPDGSNYQYRVGFHKKNVAQTVVRRKIRENFNGWCEIRFSYASSSIWINGNEFTVVIKPAYLRDERYPNPHR